MLAVPGAWMTGRTLGELRLRDEGILVLGSSSRRAVPGRSDQQTRIDPGDTLILYGRDGGFAELTSRVAGPDGDEAHAQAVASQRELADEETEREQGRLGER